MLELGAALVALCAGAVSALVLVLTGPLHGWLTFDDTGGVQKLHKAPTPRVGGVAVLAGLLAGGWALGPEGRGLCAPLALALVPAFAAGLAEDLTRRVRVRTRFWATLLSGLVFVMAGGGRIDGVDIPGVDLLLGFWLPSLVLTAFAIGGLAHAMNLIDGVNGLAAGSAVILLGGFAVIAGLAGDLPLMGLCLVACGALTGVLLLNFPVAYLFLGDAGSYAAGVLLAAVAVMLPARNPELSPLVGLLALSYPVIETLVSIRRRLGRAGGHPGRPDRLHLHSLLYRDVARRLARRLARALGVPELRNSLTGLLLWGFALASAVLAVLCRGSSAQTALGVALVGAAYALLYRRVALLGRGTGRAIPAAPTAFPDRAARRDVVWAPAVFEAGVGMAERPMPDFVRPEPAWPEPVRPGLAWPDFPKPDVPKYEFPRPEHVRVESPKPEVVKVGFIRSGSVPAARRREA